MNKIARELLKVARELTAERLTNKEHSAVNKFSSWLRNEWPMRIWSPLEDLLYEYGSDLESIPAPQKKDILRALREFAKGLKGSGQFPRQVAEYKRDAQVLEKLADRLERMRTARVAAMTPGEKVMKKLSAFLSRQKYSVVKRPELDRDWMGESITFRIKSSGFYYYTLMSGGAEVGTDRYREQKRDAERQAAKNRKKAFDDLKKFADRLDEVSSVGISQCGSKATCFDVEVRLK